MNPVYEKLVRCVQCVREKTAFEPQIGLILGSGLGALADEIDAEAVVEYSQIDGFPVSTVAGHRGRFVFGHIAGVRVAVMQGRVHYYEGYSLSDVVLPVRLMAMLGAKVLFLTNAAGGVNRAFNAGDFMLIEDHILSLFPNPLIGENIDAFGPRFPDMSQVYDPALNAAICDAAAQRNLTLRRGVYCQLTGPTFETPAEVHMLELLGADAVGMSTACEAAAARHAGMRVCGISCITNKAAGLAGTPLSHEEVFETSARVAPVFQQLVRDSIARMGEECR